MKGHVAQASVVVAAPVERVWAALTDPDLVRRYLMGAEVASDWRPGSPITWSGEYEGLRYVDKGEVLEVEAPTRLVHTHFSPLGGRPDEPGNYHTLVWALEPQGDGTRLRLSQDNNASAEEAESNRENWSAILAELKKAVEG